MQTNILWKRREYDSLENCLVNTTTAGSEIHATIIGLYNGNIYQVEYQIQTNQNWETVFLELNSRHSNIKQQVVLESDARGNWTFNGKPAEQFNGCMDVDIPLTPFTNTLPVNRLRLKPDEERQIRVIYLDMLEQQIKPVHQKYKRISDRIFLYENVPNDFEASIEVDELGLVVDYPALFIRTAIRETNYR